MDINAIFDNWRRTVTEHYFDMNGRVGRSQFWYFVVANIALAIIVAIVQSVTFLPLLAIFNLAMLLPSAGMARGGCRTSAATASWSGSSSLPASSPRPSRSWPC